MAGVDELRQAGFSDSEISDYLGSAGFSGDEISSALGVVQEPKQPEGQTAFSKALNMPMMGSTVSPASLGITEDSAVGGLLSSLVRGMGQTAGLAGDVVSYPLKKGLEYASGQEIPSFSEMMMSDLEGLGIKRREGLPHRIAENIVPVAPVAVGAQMLAGAGAGTGQYVGETVAPDDPYTQMALTAAGALSPWALKTAGKNIWKLFNPDVVGTGKQIAGEVAKEIQTVAPEAMQGRSAGQAAKTIGRSLERKGARAQRIAGRAYDKLPPEEAVLDDAITASRDYIENLQGLPPGGGSGQPGGKIHILLSKLEDIKPADKVLETPAGMIVDEAGKPFIQAQLDIIPGGPAKKSLSDASKLLRDINKMWKSATPVEREALNFTKNQIDAAIKKSVSPKAYKALEEARSGWQKMSETYREGAVGKVRASIKDHKKNLGALENQLFAKGGKEAEQLVAVMSPAEREVAAGLMVDKMLKMQPTSYTGFIANKIDNFNAVLGPERTQKLISMVGDEGSVGKLLLKDNKGLKAILGDTAKKALVRGAIGSAGGPVGTAVGMLSGLTSAVAEGKSLAVAKRLIKQAMISGSDDLIASLAKPATAKNKAEAAKLFQEFIQNIPGGVDTILDPAAGLLLPDEAQAEEHMPQQPSEIDGYNGVDEMEWNVPLDSLVKAVTEQESGGDPNAVSKGVGAKGLMQLMDATGRELFNKHKDALKEAKIKSDKYDPFDPAQNQFLGKEYLKQLMDMFDGDPFLALTAYHSGPGRVKKLLKMTKGDIFALPFNKGGLGPVGRKYAKEVMARMSDENV